MMPQVSREFDNRTRALKGVKNLQTKSASERGW